MVRPAIGSLYRFNVLGFGDGGAQSIWRGEIPDKGGIMRDRVLARERESVGTRGGAEDLAMIMEPRNCGLNRDKGILIDDRATDEMAEFDDVGDSFDHCTWNVASDGGKIYLIQIRVNEYGATTAEMGEVTFMSPFESFPVHCLYPRPVWKCRRPGNGVVTAILSQVRQRE
jgi:hypothetical protein